MLFQKHKILLPFKNYFSTFSFLLIFYSASCQNQESANKDVPYQVMETITFSELYDHLAILSSDSLEGRETGEPGQKKAAAYIREQFESYGLKPLKIGGEETYMQEFSLPNPKRTEVTLTVNGLEFSQLAGFIHGGRFAHPVNDTIGVSFAGYGLPQSLEKINPEAAGVMILNSYEGMSLHARIDTILEHGFPYIFIIWETAGGFHDLLNDYRNSRFGNDDGRKNGHVFLVSPHLASRIMNLTYEQLEKAAEKSLKRGGKLSGKQGMSSMVITASPQDSLIRTENILGFIEGSKFPEECIVVSAHYDHIGIIQGRINPGADDNGSGTAALLELAEGFSIAAGNGHLPDRSILFAAFSGEEKGLLGSGYYVRHPVFPLDETLANLNIDMIGRVDTLHGEDSSYVYLIGSDKLSPELHEISERNNREHIGLSLDYTYNLDSDPNRLFYRSDQYNFAKNNIPVIFYFTGLHEDYHKPTDTAEKIRLDNMVKITHLILLTAWEIANRDERLKLK